MSRLITDLDVMTGRVTSPIVLSAGVLITPAARDRAIANGLVIVERDGSVVGATTAGRLTAGPAATTAGPPPSGLAAPTARAASGPPAAPAARTISGAPAPPTARAAPAGPSGPTPAGRPCGCKGSPASGPAAKAGCSCGGGCGSGCGKSQLPDGLHLVRVDGGRVSWSRPVSGETPAVPPR